MKKFLLAIVTILSFNSFGQAPKEINYQGLLRNNTGSPMASKPVKIKFEIFPSLSSSSSSFIEIQSVTTNSLGLFSTQIGKVNTLSLNWSTGSWFLEVSVDTTNSGSSFSSLGRQKMVSVPYALYAETAGNTTTYSPSSNISISGTNVIDLTSTGVTAGIYGSNGAITSEIPKFTVDINGRLTTASSYTANILGDISGPLDNQKVSKLNGFNLSATAPSNGQVLQFNGSSWVPANIATGGVTTINTAAPLSGGPITSTGTISLLPSGVTAGIYGSTLTSVPYFTVDTYGRITNAGSYTLSIPSSTLIGDVKGPIVSNTVTAIQGFSVSSATPTLGQMLQFNAGMWQPVSPPAFPWVKPTSTVVALANNSDLVGIGVSAPIAKLDITDNSTLTTLSVNNSSSGNYIAGIFASNSAAYTTRITNDGTGMAMYAYKSAVATSGSVGYFNILNSANGSDVLNITTQGSGRAMYVENNASVNPAIDVYNIGSGSIIRAMKLGAQTGNVANFSNGSVANISDVITVSNNGGGNAINVSASGAGDVVLINGTNASAAYNGLNVTISSNNANAAAIRGKNTGGAGYGVFGENTQTGYGVFGANTNTLGTSVYGVYGTVSGNNSSNAGVYGFVTGSNVGVLGNCNGVGFSVYGLKPATASGGNAGRFDIQNSANTADAVFASTQGIGAAVHAASGTATTSALALLLDEGHVSSTGTAPTTTVITSLVGGSATMLSTSTDVAGRITITFGTGPFTAATYAGVIFNKPYTIAPIVILTPVSAAASTANFHVTSTTTGFTITHASAPGASSTHTFNYIVIETK